MAMMLPDLSGLAQGIEKGGSALANALQSSLKRRQENKQLQSILNPDRGTIKPPEKDENFQDKFLDLLGSAKREYESTTGETFTPSMIDDAWNDYAQAAEKEKQPFQRNVREPTLSSGQIAAIAQKNPNLANILQREGLAKEKIRSREALEERKFQTQLGAKGKERIEAIESQLDKKENALNLAKTAVESGNIGQFSKANLAQRLKIPELQTAEGATLVTSAKENLLTNISRVSAKGQNMWFEKRLNEMFPRIGQSREANLSILTMLEGEQLMDKGYVDAYNRIAADDNRKYGYPRGDVEKRARALVKPLNEQIFKKTAYKLRELQQDQKSNKNITRSVGKSVAKGTPLTQRTAKAYIDRYGNLNTALSAAKKNGYTIPTQQEYAFYQSPFLKTE